MDLPLRPSMRTALGKYFVTQHIYLLQTSAYAHVCVCVSLSVCSTSQEVHIQTRQPIKDNSENYLPMNEACLDAMTAPRKPSYLPSMLDGVAPKFVSMTCNVQNYSKRRYSCSIKRSERRLCQRDKCM